MSHQEFHGQIQMKPLAGLFTIIGPGLLVAATGVGAGDLATGAFAGSLLGIGILWAVLVGAYLKFIVTEGIARWQLATGTTILEGVAGRLGRVAIWIFLPYLVLWSFFTASALMGACGVTLHAIFPVFDDPRTGKIIFGILSSLLGISLVYMGGYRLFEKIMGLCIGVMFCTVVLTAVLLWPGVDAVLQGMFVPSIPDLNGMGLTWTVALIGGVGGTVTVLCYGYWIREEGRMDAAELPLCRIDLATGYFMTALFGLAMVIIGSRVTIEGSGVALLVKLSDQLGDSLGPAGKWLFLIGAAGAVFSSLLGVWQATPYIFADLWSLLMNPADPLDRDRPRDAVDTNGRPYRIYLWLLAFVPMAGLFTGFKQAQKLYTVTGAFFFPLLAVALLLLNGRKRWVGEKYNNGPVGFLSLVITLGFFLWVAVKSFF